MKATYKNSIRSKKLIMNAVHTLLCKKKSLNAITITDIVNEAGINRGTFYNHYNNIGDVIDEMEDELMLKITHSWEQDKLQCNSMENLINTISTSIKENESEYRDIVNYIPQYIYDEIKSKLLKEIANNFLKNTDIKEEDKLTVYLLVNGIAGSLIDYFKGKLKVDLDLLVAASINSIRKLLPSLHKE